MSNSEFIPTDTSSEKHATATKVALANAMAAEYATKRSFQELLLRKLKNTPSAADEQVLAIEKILDRLPYRREPVEMLRNPEESIDVGGDCDDLATLAVACLTAVAIPSEVQAVEDSEFGGFHLRAVCYLPPTSPEYQIVIDPVFRSEREWTMYDEMNKGDGAARKRLEGKFGRSRVTKLA
jgi:hypothetical protein